MYTTSWSMTRVSGKLGTVHFIYIITNHIRSRSDAALGNNHVFNQTIFETTTAFWTGDTITATMLANGKMARQLASKAFNSEYSFTSTNEAFSLGEMAAPILIFGDIAAGTVRKDLVLSFFRKSDSLDPIREC
jgi:hypothetical protein